jgi:N-dimethylarginine dimethylaminohydrolase
MFKIIKKKLNFFISNDIKRKRNEMLEDTTMIVISEKKLSEIVSNAVEIGVKKVIDDYNLKNRRVEYLTQKETAKYFKVNGSTISRWAEDRRLNRYHVKGRIYYKLSEIEQLPKS